MLSLKSQRRLALLEQYLDDLRLQESVSLEDFLKDRMLQYGVEHLMERIVDCSTTINGELIVLANATAPDSYYESFNNLIGSGLVENRTLNALASTAGLRNRIVHEYDVLLPEHIHRNISHFLKWYPRYLTDVRKLARASDQEQMQTDTPEGD